MAFRFQCPACKTVKTASDRALGREIPCPKCGQPVKLPSQEQIDAARAALERKKQRETKAAAVESKPVVEKRVASRPALEAVVNTTAPPELDELESAPAPIAFKRRALSSADDMDMTPMVDVTFLLLIFFMITASFSVQKSIQRPAQRKDDPSTNAVVQPEQQDQEGITVQVDEFNAFNVITPDSEKTASSKQDLIRVLTDARASGGDGSTANKLVIQAHEECIHAAVVDALDAGREAQFESFEVTTVEQFD